MNEFNSNGRLYEKLGAAYNGYLPNSNARERAYHQIREKIIYMELKPGEPLSDKVLAEQLEMSRTPVREALMLLSAYHMVVLKPQSGTFVTPIDAEWVAMEQFARMSLEKEIIRMACAGNREGLAEAYAENAQLFDACNASDAPDRIHRLHEIDNDFHGLAFATTGKIANFMHMLSYMQHIERLRVLTLMMNADRSINKEHRQIAQAILVGDKDTALLAMEKHLNSYQDTIKIAKSQYPEYFELG